MKTLLSRCIIAAAVIAACGFYSSPASAAAPKVVAVDGVGYNVQASLEDNLKTLTGKNVTVTLTSGKQLAGKVKTVGTHLLHLEKLEGKDFFDALIRLERIEAIDTRFRDYQR